MEFEIALLLAAFGGGLFGAAIGGLPAFIFTGFAVILGVAAGVGGSDFDVLTNIAFGPVFGPHIAFAGGAAAAAYAARKGLLDDGKDILAPLVGLNDPIVLIVGGLFGAAGYIVNQALLPIIGSLTDTVALTVAISGIAARLIFGGSGLFGNLSPEARERGWFLPGGDQVWAAYQQGFVQASVLGFGSGLFSAWAVVAFTQANPDYASIAVVLGFGISAASLIFLQFGYEGPITHHMTLPAAVAASTVFLAGGAPVIAVVLGAIVGALGALLGELFSRLFLIHGDTHVDPPANAIWVATTLVIVVGLIFGA